MMIYILIPNPHGWKLNSQVITDDIAVKATLAVITIIITILGVLLQ